MLDILTPNGQATLAQEQEAAEKLKPYGVSYVKTPKDSPAAVDAVLMKGEQILAVAEMKCRQMTYEDLFGKYEGTWLITNEKLIKLAEAAQLLGVPGVGYLYLVPDKRLLCVKICEPDGSFMPGISVKWTQTQATCNGGTAVRENAYVSMAQHKEV